MITESRKAESFYVAGGTLPMGAESYVTREADHRLLKALVECRFCYVLNSRQMGKSSVCVRTKALLEERGIKTAFVDLTKIGGRNVTPEQWYAGILVEIGRSLNLRSELLTFWKGNGHLSPMQRLFSSLRDVVLEAIQGAESRTASTLDQTSNKPGQVVIFIDEIDATRSLSFNTDEFFAGIRECFNRRVHDPHYEQLTFCLLGVAVPSDLIQDPRTTPFNIGERIELSDFTLDECLEFEAGLDGRGELVRRVYYWTNGHPFLTQSLCQAIARDPSIRTEGGVDALIKRDLFEPKARDTNINLADVGTRVLNGYADSEDPNQYRADVLSTYLQVLKGRQIRDDEANRHLAILKLSGLLRSAGAALSPRNRIYERVFNAGWVIENMPGQEVRRQKKAKWTGAAWTAGIAAVILLNISALTIDFHLAARRNQSLMFAFRNQRNKAEYQAYVADLNLMRTAYEDNDTIHLANLLQETAASPYRNIEWNFWNDKLNDTPLRLNVPHGRGFCGISEDSKTISIDDPSSNKSYFYSYPDLKLLHQANLPRGGDTISAGNAWRSIDLAKWPDLQVRDPFTDAMLGTLDCGNFPNYTFAGATGSIDTLMVAFVSPSGLDYAARTWNLSNLRPTGELSVKNRRLSGIGISNGASRIATIESGVLDGSACSLTVRDLKTKNLLDSIAVPARGNQICFSSSGRLVAAGLTDGILILRDVDNHKTVFEKKVSNGIAGLVGSSDLSRIVIWGSNMVAELWDMQAKRILAQKKGALFACLAPSGEYFVINGDGTRIYPVNRLRKEKTLAISKGVQLFGANLEGDIIGGTSTSEFFLIDNKTGIRKGSITWTGVSEDLNWCSILAPSGQSLIENTATGQRVGSIPYAALRSFAVSPDGTQIAYIDNQRKTLHLQDGAGHELWRYQCKTPPASVVAWSESGRYVALGTYAGDAIVLDAGSGRQLRLLSGSQPITMIVFSPDSRMIAVSTGGYSRDVRIWTWDSPIPVEAFGHTASVLCISFTRDGQRLLSTSADGTARLWDPSSGRELLRLGTETNEFFSAWFSPDDSNLEAMDQNRVLHVYRLTGVSG